MRIPPLRVHVGDRQEAVKVVEADVLGLRLEVFAEMPFADSLRLVAGIG